MLIAGEKYACEACIRGHRVSNCQHADRTLQHIAKKGRPVSQCTHCRTLRKSRAAHVKCDCGEKTHNKATCTQGKEIDTKDICCCSHGGRCACALKKEHLDPVPESDSDEACSSTQSSIFQRPRAHTVQSEGTGMTVFANGHHKPAQKHNQMAHKCGLPYVVPRAHSIHGVSPAGLANRSVDNLPHTNTIDALHSESHIKDSMVSAQQEQRMIKSEHNSPILGSTNLAQLNGQLPPLDLAALDGLADFNFPVSYDGLTTITDFEQPIFSAGLSATSVDWSHYDGLDFNSNENFTTSEFSQAPSFTGYDFGSIDQPALTTTSTSGEISDVEDFGTLVEPGLSTRPGLVTQKYGSDFDNSDVGDIDGYRLSNASSYLAMPQGPLLGSTDADAASHDIDEFIKGVTTSNGYVQPTSFNDSQALPSNYEQASKYLRTSSAGESNFQLSVDDDDALWMNDFTANSMPICNGNSDLQESNIWAQ